MFNPGVRTPYALYADFAGAVLFAEHSDEPHWTITATAAESFTAWSFTATTAGFGDGILAPLGETWRSALPWKALATPAIRG